MDKIRVVLVEDHDLSRIGLSAALQQEENIEVVGEAVNAKQGMSLITKLQPDVAIVDIGLPDLDGIELTQQIKQKATKQDNISSKILILTMHKTEDSVLAAFAAGADSYALKDIHLDNLVQAIQMTHEGNAWIDPTIARIVLKQARQIPSKETAKSVVADKSSYDEETLTEAIDDRGMIEIESLDPEAQKILDTYPLTERELDVLELIVAGCNNAKIAENLYITVGTVKTHVRNILNKLCVDDRTQAAVRALRSGLVD